VSRNDDIDLIIYGLYGFFAFVLKTSLVPELLYLPFSKQVADFIKVFGGETPRVPNRDEGLLAALAARLTMVERQS
jgi:hypothetical protein